MRRYKREITALRDNRPKGPLSPEEIEEIRTAYEDGCKGMVVIGLRGDERLTTMLLPAQPNEDREDEQMGLAARNLRRMGCDGYIHVYLKNMSDDGSQRELIVDQDII